MYKSSNAMIDNRWKISQFHSTRIASVKIFWRRHSNRQPIFHSKLSLTNLTMQVKQTRGKFNHNLAQSQSHFNIGSDRTLAWAPVQIFSGAPIQSKCYKIKFNLRQKIWWQKGMHKVYLILNNFKQRLKKILTRGPQIFYL